MNSKTQLQINQDYAFTVQLEPAFTIQHKNKENKTSKIDFDTLFSEAVDLAFSTLGNSNKQGIYLHLKNCYGISKETIPQNIEIFVDMLEHVFGRGALLLEAQIMETLKSQVPSFRFSPEYEELSFKKYVENLHNFLLNTDGSKTYL